MTTTFHLMAPLVSNRCKYFYVRSMYVPHRVRSMFFGKNYFICYDPYSTRFLEDIGLKSDHESLYEFNCHMKELSAAIKEHGTEAPKLPIVVENTATLFLIPGTRPLGLKKPLDFGCDKNPLVDLF